ncbi:MAG: hypothetical protein ACKVG4_15380 [Longimicrobiales bacterium]
MRTPITRLVTRLSLTVAVVTLAIGISAAAPVEVAAQDTLHFEPTIGYPTVDAFRLAHVELVEWLVDEYGFGKWDAYMLVGQLGESTVANIVDPIYTVVAKFPKKHLPESNRER